jgi:hypothetical protein
LNMGILLMSALDGRAAILRDSSSHAHGAGVTPA